MSRMTLAVAGGRKTQGIVEHCIAADSTKRILVLTYTVANQNELASRLALRAPISASIEVQGWFSFLLRHWIRPYLPRLFERRVLRGLNFDGDPGRYATGEARFLDDEGRAYKRHLARFATEVDTASEGAVLDRLSRIYDRIWIDEVQDLNGYDLVVIERLMDAGIELEMVGDVRQAILQTNISDPKYKQYRGVDIKRWIDNHVERGSLQLEYRSTTWRCNAAIAAFADRIFDETWGFEATVSANEAVTEHDGVFAVDPADAMAYFARFQPLCLRYSASSGSTLELPFLNIGVAKGLERDRVLIVLTGTMKDFLAGRAQIPPTTSCSLYVAATRARFSVALVADQPEELGIPVWKPNELG